MKKFLKRLLPICVAMGLFPISTVFGARVQMDLFYNGQNHKYDASEIHVYLDGESYTDPNMPTISIDGRTMMPMRGISQELGCTVTWNEAAQQVYAVSDTHAIVFEIGSTTAYKNGEAFTMDVAPLIVNDRTMLPLRAFATALDLEVKWDDPTRSVYVNSQATETPSTETPSTETPSTETPTSVTGILTGIVTPASAQSEQTFAIEGGFRECKEVYVSDNKIVLDFYGAENALAETLTATNSNIVTAIRTAQHTTDTGEVYTRVVFDLTGNKEYTVTPMQTTSTDCVIVTFESTKITDITVAHSGNMDTVAIHADGATGATVTTLTNPHRMVIDIMDATVENIPETVDITGLEYVQDVRTGWMENGAFRVVVEADATASMVWNEQNGKLVVSVIRSSLEGVVYDNSSETLILAKADSMNLNNIVHTDGYETGYYELLLPGDYSSYYGYGTLNPNSTRIKSIEIGSKNGKTFIRFNQNTINGYVIQDAGDVYTITAKNPQQVYDKILVLDAGHGATDPGTSGNGLVEKTMNLAVVTKIADYLEKHSDIKVYLTRSGDTYPSNSSRAQMANEIADLMVSIHMNAASASASGTETLYTPHSNDNNGTLTSLQAAQAVQKAVTSAFGTVNRGVKDRPDLLILNSTNVPAILLEVCFLSNAGDAQKIATSEGQNTVAQATAEAIIKVMNEYPLR